METAIAQLPNHEQDDIIFWAGHNIKQLYKQQNSNHHKERHTLSQTKNKLATNKATVFQADKGIP
jgi:hypothetical protein